MDESIESMNGTEMKAKMLLQTSLMTFLIGSDVTQDMKLKWVEENSEKFREIFNQRKSNQEFLNRAVSDTANLAREIAEEHWAGSIKRAA